MYMFGNETSSKIFSFLLLSVKNLNGNASSLYYGLKETNAFLFETEQGDNKQKWIKEIKLQQNFLRSMDDDY